MPLASDVTKPDVRTQGILADIEKLKLERITNKTFVDTDVYLDGRAFTNCIFKNCRFFVKLGCFQIGGERIHLENIEWVLLPPAQGVKAIADLVYFGQVEQRQVRQVRQPKK